MQREKSNIMATIYDFKAVASNGKEIDFRQFEAFRDEEVRLVFIDLPGYGKMHI